MNPVRAEIAGETAATHAAAPSTDAPVALEQESGLPTGRFRKWRPRVLFLAFVVIALSVIWFTNLALTAQLTENTRNRAEVRQALYTGQLISELQRNSVVPLLLARDPELVTALVNHRFTSTSQRLISAQTEIGAASILLLDLTGRVVAATNRMKLGESMAKNPAFVDAQRSKESVFSVAPRASNGNDFTFSRALRHDGQTVGIIIVGIDLARFERAWAGVTDAVVVLDSASRIILSTEPVWRGLTLKEALDLRSAPSAIERALLATAGWTFAEPDAYLDGAGVLRSESRIPFQGWKLISYTSFSSIRDSVNAILALEIMGFALLLAVAFYWTSRRALGETANVRKESAELRRLNQRLQREIAEREKAQKDLAVVEQTLAQSSKLAALGEMSASVSHELNQPLAAMKTYLAGARLLLQRGRGEEAMASFQRIDDLIERMGAITRQLKSYARKGGEAFEPIDFRSCVSGALSMMEPTLRNRSAKITRALPRQPVMVLADRIRLEQVIVNLLRNALDATKDTAVPQIELLLSAGEKAVLSVRDNGHGIIDLDSLFEPFYTTKKPGDGVGLGLAISSGIVNDLGGRLTARNVPSDGPTGGGAVFEVVLPLLDEKKNAAE